MKLAKTAFVLTLLNFLVIVGIVFKGRANLPVKDQPIIAESNVTAVITLAPTKTESKVTQTNVVAPTSQPTVDNRCIIIVDGNKYDISNFKNVHSGGDIFQCNTDMTAIFHQQHTNDYLARMSQYKI